MTSSVPQSSTIARLLGKPRGAHFHVNRVAEADELEREEETELLSPRLEMELAAVGIKLPTGVVDIVNSEEQPRRGSWRA